MRHLHPLLSYAFLLGAGTIALSATSAIALPEPTDAVPPALIADRSLLAAGLPAREEWPPDLDSLKTAAAEMSALLSTIKIKTALSRQQGRIPPQKFIDAIGQADQLIGLIGKAQTLDDIGIDNAGERLSAIAAEIMANSKF